MDLTWARILFTVSVFISFMLVLLIVFNKRNKHNYDEAAASIIDDADLPVSDSPQSNRENGA